MPVSVSAAKRSSPVIFVPKSILPSDKKGEPENGIMDKFRVTQPNSPFSLFSYEMLVETMAHAGLQTLSAISLTCKALKDMTREGGFLRTLFSHTFPSTLKVCDENKYLDPLKVAASYFSSFEFINNLVRSIPYQNQLDRTTIFLTG